MIKGKAAGWQSSIQNNRLPETITAFINAVSYAPEDKKEEIRNETTAELTKLLLAMYQVYMKKMTQWPDSDTAKEAASMIDSMKMCAVMFKQKTNSVMDLVELSRAVAKESHDAYAAATPAIYRTYKAKKYPDKNEWSTFTSKLTSITMVVAAASDFLGNDVDDELAALLYDDLATANDELANSCGYLSQYFDFRVGELPAYAHQHVCDEFRAKGFIPEPNENMVYAKLIELPAETKENCRRQAIQYKNKAAQIRQRKQAEKERKEKEAAKKRFDDYWNEHSDHKATLLKEKENLNAQLSEMINDHNKKNSELQKKLRAATDDTEIKNIDAQIKDFSTRLASLGIFKGKEKKALQGQIDMARRRKNTLSDVIATAKNNIQFQIDNENQEYERKIRPIRSNINVIDYELTRPR